MKTQELDDRDETKCRVPGSSSVVSRTLSPRNEVWDWERVSFVYLHHSFQRTFAAGDFTVALQSLNGDLLSSHFKAADGWNRS